ncbi:MAG: peptidoglycan editing factor PgeF [Desulfitobacteriaceae bacterium]|nr:peptidoglycan editing factor PgeF [Desulfitobacteriaceae bacterium]MDD4401171.1 peptidoglycan editing factor PgeF [Desulfitobacteriaceae bacterium]
MGWEWRQGSSLKYFTIPEWEAYGIQMGFSSRQGGVSDIPYKSLNLGLHVQDKPENVLEDRKLLLSELGAAWSDFALGEQVHGTNVAWVGEENGGRGLCNLDTVVQNIDGLLTQSLTGLMAMFADCVPVYFYHPVIKAVGIAHAGWKGTLGKICIRVLQELFQAGGKIEDCLIALGPSIGPCCYRIDQALAERFKSEFMQNCFLTPLGPGQFSLDLRKANRSLLIKAGVKPDNIWTTLACTACNSEDFFSYRRDGGITGRMAGWIRLL